MSIFDEFIVGLSKEQFIKILQYVYKEPYDFLFLNFDKGWDQMYHRNFNELQLRFPGAPIPEQQPPDTA